MDAVYPGHTERPYPRDAPEPGLGNRLAAKYFRWQGANKWGWIASALFGYAVLSVPAALLIHFQIAEWLGVKL